MSIYGINSSNIPRTPAQLPVRDGARPQVQQPPVPSVAVPTKPVATPAAKSAPSIPVEAPEGTDPALWSVLSGEERAFFAKAGAMGPLTYGKALREMTGAQPPAARGGRLDVKG
jgi:hypothetical protein